MVVLVVVQCYFRWQNNFDHERAFSTVLAELCVNLDIMYKGEEIRA